MGNTRKSGWASLRYVVSALLIAAVVLKILNVVQILSSGGLLSSPLILLTAIGFESAVAAYLLIGDAFLTWIATIGTFGILALSAGYALLTGQSCNCLASSVGANVMLPLDLAILAAAVWFRPPYERRPASKALVPIALSVAVGFVAVGIAHFRNTSVVEKADPLQYLLASMMVGKPWPLNRGFHPKLEQLSAGKWIVVIVRHDCEHCRKLVQTYFADPKSHRPEERTAVFVAGTQEWPFQFDHISLEPESDARIAWSGSEPFVASPAIFLVEDGVVISASDGPDAEGMMKKLHSEFARP